MFSLGHEGKGSTLCFIDIADLHNTSSILQSKTLPTTASFSRDKVCLPESWIFRLFIVSEAQKHSIFQTYWSLNNENDNLGREKVFVSSLVPVYTNLAVYNFWNLICRNTQYLQEKVTRILSWRENKVVVGSVLLCRILDVLSKSACRWCKGLHALMKTLTSACI